MFIKIVRYRTVPCLGIVGLALLVGCAGRHVSTSVSDQTLAPAKVKQAAPVTPAPAKQPEAPPALTQPPSLPAESARVMEMPPSPTTPATRLPPTPPMEMPRSPMTPIPPAPPIASAAPQPVPVAPPQAPSMPDPIRDVFFDYDQAVLRSEAMDTLGANARLLRQREAKIMIEGHCDELGTVAYNLVLGERRASVVKRYLEDSGVPGSQIAIVSYGKEQPFCTEHSTACWQSNRRAHFVLR